MTTAEVIAIEELLTALAFYSDPRGVLERQGLNPADFGIPDFYDELDFGSRATEAIKNWEAARAAAAEATSAPTPAPVSREREELAKAVEKTAADLDNLSFDFDGDSSQMDAITEAADHLRNYATELRTPHGLPGEEELAIALWADEPAGPETALMWDYESPKRQMKFRHWAQRILSRLTASRTE